MENIQEEQVQNNMTSWLDKEIEEQKQNKPAGEYPESVKFEENKIKELNISIAKPWSKEVSKEYNTTYKVIPVMENGVAKSLWTSVKNPLFAQLLKLAKNSQDNKSDNFTIKIIKTGEGKATRYNIVE